MVLRSSILASMVSAAFVVSLAACSGPSNPTMDVHDANASTEAGDTGGTTDVAIDSATTDTGSATDGSAIDGATADVSVDEGVDTATVDTVTAMDSATDTGPGKPDVTIPDVVLPDVAPETGGPMCSPGQHACACATGFYCLSAGAMCLNPSAPCPS